MVNFHNLPMSSLKVLKIILSDFIGKTVAVVGNGVFKEKKGEEIDSHDVVVRINNFVIDGYEELVGSKVSFWCTNACHTIHLPHPNVPTRVRPVFCPYFFSKERYDRFLESGYQVTFLSKKKKVRMLTGVSFLSLLSVVDIVADVYGFDFLRSGHYWNLSHSHPEKDKKCCATTLENKIMTLHNFKTVPYLGASDE